MHQPCVPIPILPCYLVCQKKKIENVPILRLRNTGCQKLQDAVLYLVKLLQYGSQHAFLAILTHSPLLSGRYVTKVMVCHANINTDEIAQAYDCSLTPQ